MLNPPKNNAISKSSISEVRSATIAHRMDADNEIQAILLEPVSANFMYPKCSFLMEVEMRKVPALRVF